MSLIIGIDGCRAGWFAVWHDHEKVIQSKVFRYASDLITHFKTNKPIIIGIDMPVVLSDSIPREADQLARKLLGKKSSSIFTAPTPGMLRQTSYEDATKFSKENYGKSISIQSWHLFPKIKDLSKITDCKHLDIHEIHPELSFRSMNNDVVILERKKDSKGFEIREALLKREFSTLDFQGIRDQYLKKDVANDDILDALAVLWSAQRVARRAATFLPANPNKPKMSIAF